MSTLLEMRENLRNFYSKYEIYLTPVLKFLLALLSFTMINTSLGYMTRLNNPIIVLVLALMCSFLPLNFIVVISGIMVVMHMYAVTLECALAGGVLFLLLFLLYFRFSPKDTIVVLLLPICFCLKVPYLIPIAVGLLGSATSIVSVSCGVIVYYLIDYLKENASAISALDADNAIARFRYIIDGMMNNRAMLVTVIAFAITVLLVYLLRRLSIDHAWTAAILVGAVTCVIIMLVGELMFDMNISILSILLGSVVSALLCKVLQFFAFNVDYSRTEYVQFEDDEYYYYVKAVPKNSVAKAKKTVKKITSVL